MDESKGKFKDGTRVKLRDGVDSTFYAGMAKVGNEGWITKHRQDRFDLPEVYIQWDPIHWAYNRQPDCWTFEDHFEAVKGDSSMAEPNQVPEGMSSEDAHFFSMMKQMYDEIQREKDSGPSSRDEADKRSYLEAVQAGIDSLADSESFVTVAIRRTAEDNLSVSIFGESLTPEADILLGSQLSALGAKFHQDAALLQLNMLESENGN